MDDFVGGCTGRAQDPCFRQLHGTKGICKTEPKFFTGCYPAAVESLAGAVCLELKPRLTFLKPSHKLNVLKPFNTGFETHFLPGIQHPTVLGDAHISNPVFGAVKKRGPML